MGSMIYPNLIPTFPMGRLMDSELEFVKNFCPGELRDRIVEEARAMIGTKYLHQGRLPREGDSLGGIDCCGVPIVIAQRLGLSEFDIDGYSGQADYQRFFGYFSRICDRTISPQSGDIATLNLVDSLHCGILAKEVVRLSAHAEVERWSFIDSSLRWGAVREHQINQRWLDRCTAFYRFPGVS
jgi:hypothetical protein